MIFHPKVGQEVQIRYGKAWAKLVNKGLNGMYGRVLVVGTGQKQKNCLIGISVLRWHPGTPDMKIVVPRGNLLWCDELSNRAADHHFLRQQYFNRITERSRLHE